MHWGDYETIGRLHALWYWCVDYAEDGDLRKHNDGRIAAAMGVAIDQSSTLVHGLVEACWLDRAPYFRVHDWWDYIGRFLQVKYRNYPNKWQRVKQLYLPNTQDNHLDNVLAPVLDQITLPNLTKPNLTKDKPPNLAAPPLHPEHKAFIDGWCQNFRAAHGFDYCFSGGKDGKAVKELLRMGILRIDLLEIAKKAWERNKTDDRAWNCKQATTIAGFKSYLNQIRTELKNAASISDNRKRVADRNAGTTPKPAGQPSADEVARRKQAQAMARQVDKPPESNQPPTVVVSEDRAVELLRGLREAAG